MITYEWDMETWEVGTEICESIINHDHSDTLAPLLARYPKRDSLKHRLVLVRTDASESYNRQWAYEFSIKNMQSRVGSFSRNFECADGTVGAKIPIKYLNEIAQVNKS